MSLLWITDIDQKSFQKYYYMKLPDKHILLVTLILLFPASPQLRQIGLPMGSFYITIAELLVIGYFIVWLISGNKKIGFFKNKSIFRKYIMFFLSLYGIYIVWGFFKKGPILAFGDFRQYLPLILFFPLLNSLYAKDSIESLRNFIFIVLGIVAVYVVLIFTFFNNYMISYAIEEELKVQTSRIYFVNSLFVLFAYLGYMISKAYDNQTEIRLKMFYLMTISINMCMLLIMQSRNHWIMAFIIWVLTLFSFKSSMLKIRYLLINSYVLILIISLCFLMFKVIGYTPPVVEKIQTSVADRFYSFTDISKVGKRSRDKAISVGTLETRIETAKRVLSDYVVPNFLLGIGFGGQIPMVSPDGKSFNFKFQIDNGYLTILAKFGLLGSLLYFLFTLKVFRTIIKIIRSQKTNPKEILLAKSFLYALIAITFGSMFSSVFVRHYCAIIGFVIMLCEIELIFAKYDYQL